MSDRLKEILAEIRDCTKQDSREECLPDSPPSSSDLSEIEALSEFCSTFQKERCFSKHHCKALFKQLLQEIKGRCLDDLEEAVTTETGHGILKTLRLLLRDESLQRAFMKGQNPTLALADALSQATQHHITMTTTSLVSIDVLMELTNIFQKLSHNPRYHDDILTAGGHVSLCALLATTDLHTLHCTLIALTNLSKRSVSCEGLVSAHTFPLHTLLHIISNYDIASRRLATDLLLLLSQQSVVCSQLHDVDGLTVLIRLLHSCPDSHVLHHSVCVIERLCEDGEGRDAVRVGGGIPFLLNLLSRNENTSFNQENSDKALGLLSAVCSVLTQLVLSDTNAQLVVQLNGVYLIAMHLLPLSTEVKGDERLKLNLQKHSLRALRYLFSMERHRSLFKRLFPSSLFELFIDIGHYTQDIGAYRGMALAVNRLTVEERDVIRGNIEAANQNKAPIFTIGGYSVLELLGSGAFGSVYKVRKPNSDGYLALKEIRCTHPSLGKTLTERGMALGRLMAEVNMVREQLRHTNVVTYHKCFLENNHLYIVMQFLDGASLLEHITSLKEKGQKFTEERLWHVFTQLILALRYIHKEKMIVHRDLSPANVMLGEGDKLTITDFGLAKQKQRELSVLESVVGTMSYWCPELVQNEPYNEKADVWAAGCILYQMTTLSTPFQAPNMLSLARKIAEVDYPPIQDDSYSSLVSEVVDRCLTADPNIRADTVQLGGMLSGQLMTTLDQLSLNYESLEKKLQREKQKTIKHVTKAVSSEQRYQQLLSTSQSTVRRRLSSSFVTSDLDVTKTSQTGLTGSYREGSPGDVEVDSLQKSIDNVFLETVSETSDIKFNRVNPLTARLRSQSMVLGGDSLLLGSHAHSRLMSESGRASPLASRMNRTASVSSTLSISPRHVREISDPVTSLLTPLHKLLVLTTLPPPTPHTLARRQLLDKYRMILFDVSSDSNTLKTELYKLSNASTDPVISLEGNFRIVKRALSELRESCDGVEVCVGSEGLLTYEYLLAVLNSLSPELKN